MLNLSIFSVNFVLNYILKGRFNACSFKSQSGLFVLDWPSHNANTLTLYVLWGSKKNLLVFTREEELP